jgi:hypothetical protein
MLLLVTDPTPYMKRKQQKDFSVSHLKLIHINMCAHALHRVHETILVLYPSVHMLLTNGKKIYVKLPARIELFKNGAPDIPLPPSPMLRNLVVCHCALCGEFLNLLFCGR